MLLRNSINTNLTTENSGSGNSAKVPTLLRLLRDLDINFLSDPFLTDMIKVTAVQHLRDMKYRARIPVKKGMLLYGIMDEWNILEEGEVYIVTTPEFDQGRTTLVQDRIVITRSPALHPGDMQVVKAVDVPENSPLKSLYNCVVFSQRGARDLPSQLGGGDLDGDMFHIIYDMRLVPEQVRPPAGYDAAKPKDLGRPVEMDDMIDFFIDFMQADRLGQISNLHKTRADQAPKGTLSEDCLTLAEMASRAVDFSKSGQPVSLLPYIKNRINVALTLK